MLTTKHHDHHLRLRVVVVVFVTGANFGDRLLTRDRQETTVYDDMEDIR